MFCPLLIRDQSISDITVAFQYTLRFIKDIMYKILYVILKCGFKSSVFSKQNVVFTLDIRYENIKNTYAFKFYFQLLSIAFLCNAV